MITLIIQVIREKDAAMTERLSRTRYWRAEMSITTGHASTAVALREGPAHVNFLTLGVAKMFGRFPDL
jgi:hypothetical protein